jgi:hypothetical protein
MLYKLKHSSNSSRHPVDRRHLMVVVVVVVVVFKTGGP